MGKDNEKSQEKYDTGKESEMENAKAKKKRGRPPKQAQNGDGKQDSILKHLTREKESGTAKVDGKEIAESDEESEEGEADVTIRDTEGGEEELQEMDKKASEVEDRLIAGVAKEMTKQVSDLKEYFNDWMRAEFAQFAQEMKRRENNWIEERRELRAKIEDLENRIQERDNTENKWKKEMEERMKNTQNTSNDDSIITKLSEMEYKMELRERKERRNNIIIKGVKLDEQNLKESALEFLKDKMNVDIQAQRVFKLGGYDNNGMVLLELESREDKMQVMKAKFHLKGSNIFVDDDLTPKEQEIQRNIRDIAKREEQKGQKVRVGYKKLEINGQWLKWNERKNVLEHGNFFRGRLNPPREK